MAGVTKSDRPDQSQDALLLQKSEITDEIEGLLRERKKIAWATPGSAAALGAYAAFVSSSAAAVVAAAWLVLMVPIGLLLYKSVTQQVRERERALAALVAGDSRRGPEAADDTGVHREPDESTGPSNGPENVETTTR